MPAELDAEPGNEHPRSAHWQLDPSAQAAAQVRHSLDAVFEQWGLSEDARDAALLVAYELIANGIDYGTENSADRLLLSAAMIHDHVRVEVQDAAPTATPELQPLNPQAPRGRGLLVVDQLATRWGWSAEGASKTVWAEVPLGWYPGTQ